MCERTQEEFAKWEEASAARAAAVLIELGLLMDPVAARPGFVTCQRCGANEDCEFAWDYYNTDGDCLAEK